MTGAKLCLASAAGLGIIDLSQIADVKQLGTVGLLLIALTVVWRDGKKMQARNEAREDKLAAVIDRNTQAMAANAEIMRDCHNKGRQ